MQAGDIWLAATSEEALVSDAESEVRRLRRRLKELKEEAATNERILRRSQVRQMELLEAESLPSLLQRMVKGLKSSYGLDTVTLVLADPDHEIRHLLLSAGHHPDEFPGVTFVDTTYGLAPQLSNLRQPWLGRYRRSDHQLLFEGEEPSSIALLPLRRLEHLIGCICFGSGDETRFTREHATDFLHHLAIIASFALENVVNRARLVRSGLTDVLTGWHNRRYLQTRLREELARAQRDETPLVCMMIDVDHFKRVNDQYGHLVGDEILCEVAHRIEFQVRASDVSARYGGEEFVILLPNTDVSQAAPLAERIRTTVSGTPIPRSGGDSLPITVSIGIAQYRPKVDDDLKLSGDRLLAQADVALYEAKAAGRNAISVAEER